MHIYYILPTQCKIFSFTGNYDSTRWSENGSMGLYNGNYLLG